MKPTKYLKGRSANRLMKEKRNDLIHENPFYKYLNNQSEYGFDIPDTSMFGMLQISEKSHPEAVAIDYFGRKFKKTAEVWQSI